MKKILFYMALCGISAHTLCASDYLEVECCDNQQFHLGVDYLYWKVQQENMVIASFVNLAGETPTLVDAKSVRPGFKYESGFQINLDYTPVCSDWQFNVKYVYIPFRSDTYSKVGTPPTSFFATNATSYPILTGLIAFNSLTVKWSGNLSYADIDFSHTISITNCFELRPHIGFRGLWMDQTLSLEGDPQTTDLSLAQIKMKEKMQGYGLEGGLWGDWSMGCGLSAIGHIGGSILYSNFKNHLTNQDFLDADLVLGVNSRDKEHSATPAVDYLIGLQYAASFSNISIVARLTWEQQVFFDLNQIAQGGGNFSTQGITAGLTFGF